VSRADTVLSTTTMALFDVPGWSVPDDPVTVTSKKRKWFKHDSNKIRSATVNVEKVMKQLSAHLGPTAEGPRSQLKQDKEEGLSTEGGRPPKRKHRHVEGNKSQTPTPVVQVETHKTSKKKRKKDREREASGDKGADPQTRSSSQLVPESPSTLTSLQHDMKQSLDGARFRYVIYTNFYAGDSQSRTLKSRRWINEKLYKSDSAHAHAMMREDPAVFNEVCLSMPLPACIHSGRSTVSQRFSTTSRVLAI
jgi:ribosomal RNA-processing protein 8